MTSSRINLQLGEPIIVGGQTHGVQEFLRPMTRSTNAVPNGGLLKFDTIGLDTNGFAPTDVAVRF